MQAQERNADAALYGSGKAMVVTQPKGVVGNMALISGLVEKQMGTQQP